MYNYNCCHLRLGDWDFWRAVGVADFWFGRSDCICSLCVCVWEHCRWRNDDMHILDSESARRWETYSNRVVLLLVAVGISRGPCPAWSNGHDCSPESTTRTMYLYKTVEETPSPNTFITKFCVTSQPCNNFHPSLLFHLLRVLILLFSLATNLFNWTA